jgi:uncharacterized membrane protein YhfC
VVVLTQPASVGSFVADGLLFGAKDFGGAAAAMLGGSLPALLLLALQRRAEPSAAAVAAGSGGGGAERLALGPIWTALSLFMALRATIGLGRALRPGSPALADSGFASGG